MLGYDDKKIEHVFTYHPPVDDKQAQKYERIRNSGMIMAKVLAELCPNTPELTTAIDKIREAVMWANASIACNEEEPEEEDKPHKDLEKLSDEEFKKGYG